MAAQWHRTQVDAVRTFDAALSPLQHVGQPCLGQQASTVIARRPICSEAYRDPRVQQLPDLQRARS